MAVCRELTKLHEEVRRGSAAELAAHYREQPGARRGRARVRRRAQPGGARAASDALAALRELIDAGAQAATGGRGGGAS